ncbi:MAG: hypothetical protein ACPL4N_03760, partial [Candidatus Norongarragalinales archaeon]
MSVQVVAAPTPAPYNPGSGAAYPLATPSSTPTPTPTAPPTASPTASPSATPSVAVDDALRIEALDAINAAQAQLQKMAEAGAESSAAVDALIQAYAAYCAGDYERAVKLALQSLQLAKNAIAQKTSATTALQPLGTG